MAERIRVPSYFKEPRISKPAMPPCYVTTILEQIDAQLHIMASITDTCPTQVVINTDLYKAMTNSDGFWERQETKTQVNSTIRILNYFTINGLRLEVVPKDSETFFRLEW